ncbi:3-oxoacyl-ACP synthase [Ectothiorhodospira haloalkaliphila]|uniref:3-oxoacyl-[acyl-carrier-protein] synthase 2 n=1 Tax=Ectothiorhodospira haloalkaliphila TaxID=421628 RepID=W8KQI2_9GAMM|nr:MULTISPECIES: beta-ketoacyl-ACP synthase II [Ectothiorhodospira]AHK79257.1 3-oxoacyl-ACP synthase [Ectothiorhodospira haloalkaliphila]MCG5494691.1 beta-ketoacyl-ACP synthase II [Ectothiorhodospira variabilis]MCG5505087.1 beta-ketoacyl-ACP synthase II [Ectothiorhodospira variabilis]MCG5508244.1 beta-ketoacyl-ACP synthase II [Ectothiorhodospira variabilis]MCG5524805.1 beta-ketoacyl-ACP synthase II [Ectothiorhodospira haloalkaliphila]
MSKRRVVITGLGIVSPVGSTINTAWDNITAGRSGISPIDVFDASEMPVRISGAVRDFNADDYISPKEQRKMDTFVHYGMAAGIQAIRDAGVEVTEENAERIGVAIGSGIGGLPYIEKSYAAFLKGGARKISPFFVPSAIINMVAGNLSIMFGLKGPNISIVSACATGTHNIGDAARMIKYGEVDMMVAGGAEMATTPLGIGGFAAARALSTRNDDPTRASRPWDKDRDGFVLGDGAGVVVLEDYEHAKARGARIYCELSGFGWNSDAHHMTQPSEGGEGAAACMLQALKDAGINPDEVDYVNAHGTSTPAGDKAETMAVKRALGDHAYKTAVSSTKSMTGHLLGAAGGIEAVFSALALHHGVLPPTINLDNPDPACDLDYVPNTARETNARVAVSNSFGFGGTNGSLVFNKL